MENGMNNQMSSVDDYIEKADDQAKKMYMQRIWQMEKDAIFHELMRVHGESSKLLLRAEAEIKYLKSLLDGPEDGDARH
jgi:hypothetical protein